MVHPLVHHADGALGAGAVRHGVLGEHGEAERGDELGDGVVDLGVVVVRAAGEHDTVGVVALDPVKRLVAGVGHGLLEVEVGLPRGVDGGVHLGAGDVGAPHAAAALGGVGLALDGDHLVEAPLELPPVVVGQEGCQVLHGGRGELVDVELQGLRVAHDDGAVVVVAGGLVLLALPAHAGHPDEVDVLAQQVHHVAVGELCRVADGLRGHGLDAGLVGGLGGVVRRHHGETQLGEERVPEGVVLVHVEGARYAHGAAGRLLAGPARTVEQQAVLDLEEVGGGALGLGAAGALLAAVAGDEAPTAAEVVDGEQAVVGAAAAVGVDMPHLEVVDLIAGEQRGGAVLPGAVAGEEGGAVGAHAPGDVGADGRAAAELLEGAQRGVAHEGAALDHDLPADGPGVAHLDDLEQRVLDDRVGQARGDVAHGGALLLGLLHAAVHEHGAAAAEVHGGRRAHGRGGEVAHVHAHGVGEALDERAAAARAGLVEHDRLDDAVAHAQALHVLAADVEDELHVGHERLGTAKVGHGLDLAGVGLEGLDEQGLAVAGGGHVADGRALGQCVVEVVHDDAGGAEHVAVVVAVPGAQELAVLAHHGGLHGRGAGVDADEHAAAVALEAALGDHLGAVAGAELLEGPLRGEERGQALDLGALCGAEGVEGGDDVVEGDEPVALAGHGSAGGHEEVGVLGHHAVLLVEVEGLVEALAKLGEVLERAAEEGDVAADGVAAGQARHGLVGHRLEDGGGDVGRRGALVEQGLDVGLGEDAAATRDGVDVRGVAGQLVEAGGVGVEQRRHLVDERARATGAGAVHALLDAVVEVDDLGVLAAELDGAVGLRDERLDGALGGDDLLDELEVEPLGQQEAAGTGDGHAHGGAAHVGAGALEELLGRGADVGVVALVVGVDQLAVGVEHGHLDGGGADVDAEAEVGAGEVQRLGRSELGARLHQVVPAVFRGVMTHLRPPKKP